jgi:hypothetical protein
MKNPIFDFQETRICLRKSSKTAVKIKRLSIPAQGQAIENLAVPKDPETSKVGIPVMRSVPATTVLPSHPNTPAAKPAVVGTSI